MADITVALDWTPNTNHTGFYVARHLGYYRDEGLNVSMISPHTDEYKRTPASRVADGTATFAVAPSESVISYNTAPAASRPPVKAVAALLATSDSAIVTLASSCIDRPRLLDGKTYASYAARYEGRIVQQLIVADGGKGEYKESVPPMLGIWDTLLKGEADATWVFMGWEGVEAKQKGVQLNAFKLEDFHIPYGYSPVLLAHADTLSSKADVVGRFLKATARGYQHAAKNPAEAAEILLTEVAKDTADAPLPKPLDRDMVVASQEYMAKQYLDAEGRWGRMEAARWDAFLDWLSDKGLLTTWLPSRTPAAGVSASLDCLRGGEAGEPIPRDQVKSSDLFTNEFLDA